MNIVTTFSPSGWGYYGKRFVESFLKHWPQDIALHVFLEGQEPPMDYPEVQWHDLRHDWDHEEFVSKYSGPEYNSKSDFNEMSVRFSHKVFAVTRDTALPMDGWRVWIDADTVTKADVTPEHLARLFPADKSLTYLGRRGWMRTGSLQKAYTECGFVGYNLDDFRVRAMLVEMRSIYTSGKLFSLGRHNWHDSYVFDYCRDRQGFSPDRLNDLAAGLPSHTFHPWPRTVLGEIMEHNKGPGRKAAAYGGKGDC